MTLPHTEGPWRWEYNAAHKSVHIVGGRKRFDLTVMDFTRWGMSGAVPLFRDTSVAGMNIMHRLCDRADWIAPEAGRHHHKDWHQLVIHPDARLMAAAPRLLAALKNLKWDFPYPNATTEELLEWSAEGNQMARRALEARMAIAEAGGTTP